MGEYIQHPITGEEIKIGVLDESFFSKQELLEFKAKGFLGFYAGNFDTKEGRQDSLDLMINETSTLFKLPKDCPFNPEVHTVIVKLQGKSIDHHKVYLQKKGNRGSAYTYTEECQQKEGQELYAVMIGERYNEKGEGRTILKCDCCEALFSLDIEEAERLKKEHPYWANWIKPNTNL